MDIVLDADDEVPLIEQVFRCISDAIRDGTLKPGQQLPSIRRLASQERLTFHIVVGAYERLQSYGLISAQPGRGYFVCAMPKLPSVQPQPAAPVPETSRLAAFWNMFHGDDRCMKVGCGWLPPAWRDTKELARHVRRTANFGHSSLVEYGDPGGYLPLRQHLVRHLGKRLQVALSPSQLLTTLGATQALDLLIRHIVQPGDRVLVDDPCNSTLVQLIKMRGAQVVGIPRRQDGPDLQAFEAAVSQSRIRAFFINTQLHNPTGTSLSPQCAFRLLQLAHAHDVVLVEDDVYGDFCHEGSRLVSLDGLRKVIYIGSFSKTLSANLRVGYLLAPAPLVAELADLKLLTSVSVPIFFERFLSAMLADGTYARHLDAVRRRLQSAQADVQESFQRWGWEMFHRPAEGMFLWVRHPAIENQAPFIERAFAQDILLAPGALFSASGSDSPWFRINVGHLDPAKAEGLFAGV